MISDQGQKTEKIRWFGHAERLDVSRLTEQNYRAKVDGNVGDSRFRSIWTSESERGFVKIVASGPPLNYSTTAVENKRDGIYICLCYKVELLYICWCPIRQIVLD